MIKAQTSQLSITMFQNMSEAYQLPDFLEFVFLLTAFFACKFANSHHASFALYFYPILSRYTGPWEPPPASPGRGGPSHV